MSLCAQVSILLCFILYLQSVKFHSIGLCVLIRLIQSSCLNESLCGCFSIGEALSHLKFTSGSVCLVLVCDSSHFRFFSIFRCLSCSSFSSLLFSLAFPSLQNMHFFSFTLCVYKCLFQPLSASVSNGICASLSVSLTLSRCISLSLSLFHLNSFFFPFSFPFHHPLFSIRAFLFRHFLAFFFFVGLTGSWTNVLVFAPSNFCFK